jgi:hypothetical protein
MTRGRGGGGGRGGRGQQRGRGHRAQGQPRGGRIANLNSRNNQAIVAHLRDEEVVPAGADIVIPPELQQAVRDTTDRNKDIETKKNYRRRILQIINWFRNHPNAEMRRYYHEGVRQLTEEELSNPDLFFHNVTEDLKYDRLNVDCIMAFMAAHKQRAETGIYYSQVQLRKYDDAIKWCADQHNQLLPPTYHSAMKSFLDGYRNEHAEAKMNGLTEEHDSDPISWGLFTAMLGWCITHAKDPFLWAFTLLQWNCMARSINIGVLALHNLKMGEDNIVIEHDKTKADQGGINLTQKHVYANPKSPVHCPILALGVYFAIERSRLSESERLFHGEGKDTASARYCKNLASLFQQREEDLRAYIRIDHASPYGLRKGAATHASSGTTAPPSVAAIAARGDWTITKILDIYWRFCQTGDEYLGRLVVGMDPKDKDFAILPPHFNDLNPMSNEVIRKAMILMYGPILESYQGTAADPTSTLLLCLASVLYHSEWLLSHDSSHPFYQLPIFSDPDLLREAKALVTLESTGHVTQATGIPPYTAILNTLEELFVVVRGIAAKTENFSDDIRTAVDAAYEHKQAENSVITPQAIREILDEAFGEQQQQTRAAIDENLERISQELSQIRFRLDNLEGGRHGEGDNDDFGNNFGDEDYVMEEGGQDDLAVEPVVRNGVSIRYKVYCYGGDGDQHKFYHIPKGFQMPAESPKLLPAMQLWLVGMPMNSRREIVNGTVTTYNEPVRPFRLLKTDMLPKKFKSQFSLSNWRRIFEFIEQDPTFVFESSNPGNVQAAYDHALEYLKTRVSFAFANPKVDPRGWRISNWCKTTAYSYILAHGTQADKEKLPQATNRNRAHLQHRPRRQPEGADGDGEGDRVVGRRRRKRQRRNGGTDANASN